MTETRLDTRSGTGNWVATIRGYREGDIACRPRSFVSNGEEVVIEVGEASAGPARLNFRFRFAANIANQVFFFGQPEAPRTPSISVDRGGRPMSYLTAPDKGHITLENFDHDMGKLLATGSFSFIDHEHPQNMEYQVVFKIDLKDMVED